MQAAIAHLQIALETLHNNQKINTREGNAEQADLERTNAIEIARAIHVLSAVVEAPNLQVAFET